MTSQIHFRDALADPVVQAREELREIGGELLAELSAKVALATEMALPVPDREELQSGLLAFSTHEVVRYLLAIDHAVYAVAAGSTQTRLLIRALRVQHDLVAARIGDLGRADNSAGFTGAAHALVGLLEVVHHVEQEVLIPALAMLPGVDLPLLVDDVHTLLAGGTLIPPVVLDVRFIPDTGRHPHVFGACARLAPGESFVLVDIHDPEPLLDELQASYPDQFAWDHVETGPDRWRVRVGRIARDKDIA